jgi:hypothetical protein
MNDQACLRFSNESTVNYFDMGKRRSWATKKAYHLNDTMISIN